MRTANRYNALSGEHRRVPEPGERRPPAFDAGLGAIAGRLSRRLNSLDTEDLLLLAVIYLMYRESGDRQLLTILAALLFL